jgi:Protein of unknown function (DUF968)
MKRVKSPNYLDFIRSLPCVICGDNTTVEAAHIRFGDRRAAKRPTGMGEKPDDRWALPLCGKHHRKQHEIGERLFWYLSGDPIFVAMALQLNTGNRDAAEQIISVWSKNAAVDD